MSWASERAKEFDVWLKLEDSFKALARILVTSDLTWKETSELMQHTYKILADQKKILV